MEHDNTQVLPEGEPRKKMSVKRAAEHLDVSIYTLYRFMKERKLGYRLGRKVIVDLPELLNVLKVK